MNAKGNDWSKQQLDLLRKLWGDGLSASKIAAQIPGKTRNAIVGKAHRLGLSGRVSPIKRIAQPLGFDPAPRKRARPKPPPERTEPLPVAQLTHAKPAPIKPPTPIQKDERAGEYTLVEVSTANTCRWPFGERNFTFCGAEREDPHDPFNSYCAKHHQRAIRPIHRADAA